MPTEFQTKVTAAAAVGLLGAVGFTILQKQPTSPGSERKNHAHQRATDTDSTPDTPVVSRQKQQIKKSTNKAPDKRLKEALLPHTDSAISNERIVRFNSEEDFQAFLKKARDRGITILETIDRFNAARVRFSNYNDLADLIDKESEGLNYIVNLPRPPADGSIQDGAVGFGNSLKSWLGITGDNSNWGAGIKVAVIDSGVVPHPALADSTQNINLSGATGENDSMGHGTAVASLIAGAHPLTPGIAPRAEILSLQVTDEHGSSSSFDLAQGIISAVDNGAQIINISMGSPGASELIRDAVSYAQEKGVVIVASSGNEGSNTPSFPAGFEGVISVGAVDANSSHLDFSNQSSDLSIAAPGLQVNAAWTGDRAIKFTGTSASAPIVSGAIAATMSQNPGMTATEAAELVLNYSNEAGAPGADSSYGSGVLDVGRIMQRNTPGIVDAAVASHTVIPASGTQPFDQVQLTVQNRGTSDLINQGVSFNVAGAEQQLNIPYLKPGQIFSYTLPIDLTPLESGNSVQVSSRVNGNDAKVTNNQKTDVFKPAN